MLLQSDIDKIIQCANDNGWGVEVNADIPAGTAEFEFNTDTPCGQNVIMTCYLKDSNPDTLVKDVYDYWQAYDPDYETTLWIGPDGHGRNGAPYRISDIVHDMEAAEERMEELFEALNEIRFDYYNEDI